MAKLVDFTPSGDLPASPELVERYYNRLREEGALSLDPAINLRLLADADFRADLDAQLQQHPLVYGPLLRFMGVDDEDRFVATPNDEQRTQIIHELRDSTLSREDSLAREAAYLLMKAHAPQLAGEIPAIDPYHLMTPSQKMVVRFREASAEVGKIARQAYATLKHINESRPNLIPVVAGGVALAVSMASGYMEPIVTSPSIFTRYNIVPPVEAAAIFGMAYVATKWGVNMIVSPGRGRRLAKGAATVAVIGIGLNLLWPYLGVPSDAGIMKGARMVEAKTTSVVGGAVDFTRWVIPNFVKRALTISDTHKVTIKPGPIVSMEADSLYFTDQLDQQRDKWGHLEANFAYFGPGRHYCATAVNDKSGVVKIAYNGRTLYARADRFAQDPPDSNACDAFLHDATGLNVPAAPPSLAVTQIPRSDMVVSGNITPAVAPQSAVIPPLPKSTAIPALMMPLPTDSLATFGNAFASPDVPAFPAHGAFENPPSASQAATAWGVFVTPPTDAYTEAQNAARRPNGGFPLFAPFTVK